MRLPPRFPSTVRWDLCTVLTLALLNVYLAQLADSLPSTMVEGDMAVPEEQGGQVGVQQSFVLAEDSLWAEGLVPFRFEKMELVGGDLEELFRDEDMQMIRSVLDGITEAVPCVRFSEVADSHTGHCLIFTVMGDSARAAQGCWSFVGKVGPQGVVLGGKTGQSLNLGQNCLHRGIVLHEVMHALGATHEQNREDRDLFVRINNQNILENARANFEKKTEGFNTRGTPYDYQSIMHYKASDFSKNGEATITPLRRNITLRERSELSLIDIVELSKVYEGITSTTCFSTEMLLRYATQLETMKSRWNSEAALTLFNSQNEIIQGLNKIRLDQNELLSTCEKSRDFQNTVIQELLNTCKPELVSNNKRCWKDVPIRDSPLAVCARDSQGQDWIVIQQRGQFGNSEQYFGKTFADYEEGFSSQGELWLGLEHLEELTRSHSWELWVELTTWGTDLLQPRKLHAFYTSFKVGKGPGYQLTVGGFESTRSTLGDSLKRHNGMKFSTKDKDQDSDSSGSCSQSFGNGGWWYQSCHNCNLNGNNYRETTVNYKGINWHHKESLPSNYSFKESRIMIKIKNEKL